MYRAAFVNKIAWVSGHTGFKGAWLVEWLLALGAKVYGFALPPPTSPALFNQLGLGQRMHYELGDIRDLPAVSRSIIAAQPDYIFHLAAQPLVREAYAHPVETYATNVLGTVHVLDALRGLTRSCAAVFVTTDKCYENREWSYGYREEDSLGGYDPYSSSKAAAELVNEVLQHWPGHWEAARNPHDVHEAGMLQLCVDKARHQLKWSPVWRFEEAVARTVCWYRQADNPDLAEQTRALTRGQIDDYCRQAKEKQLAWAAE